MFAQANKFMGYILHERGVDMPKKSFEDSVMELLTQIQGDMTKMQNDMTRMQGDMAQMDGRLGNLEKCQTAMQADIVAIKEKQDEDSATIELSYELICRLANMQDETDQKFDRIRLALAK